MPHPKGKVDFSKKSSIGIRRGKPLQNHVLVEKKPDGTAFCRKCQEIVEFISTGSGDRCVHVTTRNSHKYGIKGFTLRDYADMYISQGGLCAICLKPETTVRHGRLARLSIDHDHRTGRVRGLLCHGCNTGLGSFGDSSIVLKRARKYLRKSKKGYSNS